jgi:hypothetical protein
MATEEAMEPLTTAVTPVAVATVFAKHKGNVPPGVNLAVITSLLDGV